MREEKELREWSADEVPTTEDSQSQGSDEKGIEIPFDYREGDDDKDNELKKNDKYGLKSVSAFFLTTGSFFVPYSQLLLYRTGVGTKKI